MCPFEEASYECPVCNQVSCSTVLTLVRHLIQQHMQDTGTLKAIPVENNDTREAALNEPSEEDLELSEKKYILAEDIPDVDTEPAAPEEQEPTDQDDKDKFPCPICHRSYSQNANLQKHIRAVHEGRKDFKCDICGKGFTQKGNMEHHVRTIHQAEKKFQCKICLRQCGMQSQLVKHIQAVHEGRRDFQCHICFKRFSRRENLTRHVKGVHENHRGFNCKVCFRAFRDKGYMEKHVAKFHANVEQ